MVTQSCKSFPDPCFKFLILPAVSIRVTPVCSMDHVSPELFAALLCMIKPPPSPPLPLSERKFN
jgi:hypothetical protein